MKHQNQYYVHQNQYCQYIVHQNQYFVHNNKYKSISINKLENKIWMTISTYFK